MNLIIYRNKRNLIYFKIHFHLKVFKDEKIQKELFLYQFPKIRYFLVLLIKVSDFSKV